MPSSKSKVVDESTKEFRENDRVEVNYKGDKWKYATVVRRHGDGTYRISCDDKQEFKHVPARKLARIDDADGPHNEDTFMLYDVVEVRNESSEVWESALIQGVNKSAGMYEVLYDDGGDVARVGKHMIRRPQNSSSSKVSNSTAKLQRGDRVYVKPGDHDEEFAATIESVDKDGSCHVKFDDKALGKESFVPRSHIRRMEAEGAAAVPFSEVCESFKSIKA